MWFLILFAFLAGIFTVLSPCILPILPFILSAGLAEGRWRPLAIVIGLVLSFTFFTLSLTAIVHATGLSPDVLRYAAIILMIVFGLIMLFPRLSAEFAKWTAPLADLGQKVQQKSTRTGFAGGLIFGIALGLLWTPCAGPILAAIIILVATQPVSASAVIITLAYAIGAAIPLFLIAYGSGKLVHSSKRLSVHAEGIRQFFGCLMIATALAIALHWDVLLQQKITAFFPVVMVEDNPRVKQELEKLSGRPGGGASFSGVAEDKLSEYGKAPELVGVVNWINSPPLSLMQLQGKVVLIDFWTYSCINCLRTLPYLKKWYADYKDKGLVIIGVHTPEFEFEKDPKNVAEAAARLGVTYPIAQDNDYKVWQAFHNTYWPAHYLIDQKGNLRMVHFGEGGYLETENGIRELLGMAPLKMQETVVSQRPISPETYLGMLRGKSYTSENQLQLNQIVTYAYKTPLKQNQVGLKGSWKVERERITAEANNSYLDMNYLSKRVYLVLSGSSKTPFVVYLDGKKVGEFIVNEDRKYDIVNAPYGNHLLSLKVPEGVSAYAFTFGDEE